MKETNYFIDGYKVAKKLEKIWKKYGDTICISTPSGIDFFNTRETTPIQAVKFLSREYDVPYTVVGEWVTAMTCESARFALN